MVSIILPCYNTGKHLQAAIDSVLDQTYSNWELIIINDGSTDNSENIIKQFNDNRITCIFQENQGVSAARNVGLSIMRGDYFCFLDADDHLSSNSLESRLQIFRKNPQTQFVDGHVKVYDQNLKKIQSYWAPTYRGNPLNHLLSLSGNCFFGPTWMIRRKKNKVYRFHEKLTHGEDLLFYIEQSLDGGLYDYCEEDILYYRKGHTSAMKNLKGLEIGYRYIYQKLQEQEELSSSQIVKFKKKVKCIIFNSYLGNYQPIIALMSLSKKW